MIKCLIFDLDGTLVDTLKDLCACSNEVLNEYNGIYYDPEIYKVDENELIEFEKNFPYKEKEIREGQFR